MPREDDSPPPLPGHCLNCGTRLAGPYCARCGQREFDFRQGFWHIIVDALEHLFHLDGRFSRSVVDLLFRPGRLTRSFLAGKRQSQVPPLRFYLFVSLIFFGTLSLRDDDPGTLMSEFVRTVDEETGTLETGIPIPTDEVFRGLRDGFNNARARGEITPGQAATWNRVIDRLAHPQAFIDFLAESAPNFLFFSLPLLALTTRIVFWTARRTYLEHLVVTLHIGSFFFTFGLIVEGWEGLLGFVSPTLAATFSAVATVYALAFVPWLFAVVFQRGAWGTLWRSVLLAITWGLLFLLTFVIVVAIYVGY